MERTERYRVLILTFESEKMFANPFLDCCVKAVFTGPSGQTIVREAYWDGENVYRVAFAPTEEGIWSYAVNAPGEALTERRGRWNVCPTRESLLFTVMDF